MIKTALISVFDKKGIVDFAKKLREMEVVILSTGGTAKLLRENDIAVIEVADFTGFPEMMDGRVKTLHPKIYGGILARRDNSKDVAEIKSHGLTFIDMVVVNLYPFEEVCKQPDVTIEVLLENIDIGGPTMLRAAAKNFKDVVVIIDPSIYDETITELQDTGDISLVHRGLLASEVFVKTSKYDKAINMGLYKGIYGSF